MIIESFYYEGVVCFLVPVVCMISIVANFIGNIWNALFGKKSFLKSFLWKIYLICCYYVLGSKGSLKILIVGLDNEGKLTLCHRIFQSIYPNSLPGRFPSHNLIVEYRGYLLSLIDSSNPVRARIFAEQFSFDAAVFVVDGEDRERLSEAKAYLKNVEKMLGVDKPLLIFGKRNFLCCYGGDSGLIEGLGLPSSVDLAVRDAVLAVLIINKRKDGFGLGRIPRDVALIIAKMVFETSGDFELWESAGRFVEKKRNLLRGSVKILKKNVALQMCSFVQNRGYLEGFEWLLKIAIDGT